MKTVLFPYGKEKIEYTFGDELKAVLESKIEEYDSQKSEQDLILEAMQNPVNSKTLKECGNSRIFLFSQK